jgi:hypothetical protein
MKHFPLRLELHKGAPNNVRQLVWEIFFASRGRGISLTAHFPWLNDDKSAWSLSIEHVTQGGPQSAAACLVLREVLGADGSRFALVGLVCVSPEMRGCGLCSDLIEAAIQFGRHRNWQALVLWTTKPAIYARYGFQPDGQEIFGVCERSDSVNILNNLKTEPWPNSVDPKSARGLPPFATRGQIVRSPDAMIVVLDTPQGPALAEWSGDDRSTAALLRTVMPKRWFLNAHADDSIMVELQRGGFRFLLQPSGVRLVRSILATKNWSAPRIPILDRI